MASGLESAEHLIGVTVSMRVMSAGDGYRYLLRSVVAGDGVRSLSTPLTRYYADTGTPPGRWLGAGVADLPGSAISVGELVSEEQLRQLVGEGRDPSSGVPLGRPYRVFASVANRVAARVAALDPGLSNADRLAAVAEIEGVEAGRDVRRAVAGFDFTFSVPKSASILWAVGDAQVRGAVEAAHHAAVADVLAFMEREVAATRMGRSDGSGAVVQAEVTGLIATGFDHFDSRAGDPHLHTHVVIANKARAVADGRWRSLDGRPLHAAVVGMSELHEALVMDRLSRDLGVTWEARARGRDRNPFWAIATVPAELQALFSSRSRDIDIATDALVGDYLAAHGRRPGAAAVMKLRAQATLSTRPEKEVRSLSDLTTRWRGRVAEALGRDAVEWARGAIAAPRAQQELRAADVPPALLSEWGREVVTVAGEKRSTWRHWNLVAEAARQTMGWRFATTADREAVTSGIVAAAEAASVALSPPELASSPAEFRRADGSSRFRPRHATIYSSEALLAAEARLLEAGRDCSGPTVPAVVARQVARRGRGVGGGLGRDQAAAVVEIASSGRVVDVLVGPAGAGKTTAMRTLRAVWESSYGPGSVVGLAPSAAAAEVLAGDLGITTENTAKWLQDHDVGTGVELRAGQLVIVDEASLAGTAALDRIAAAARAVGAKLMLVGDHAQLQAVDAGGAFAMLAADRGNPPELTDVRRFHADWEKAASLELRGGDTAALDAYASHGRIIGGDLAAVTRQALTAWQADLAAGRTSVLIADTVDTVRDLNARARAAQILAGAVEARGAVRLREGVEASVGDVVISRRNDRRLLAGRGWVRNGDRWLVQRTYSDGSATVRRAGRGRGVRVRLPAAYVAAEVELAYAITAHRAQGATVDTGHAILTASSTRETAYVAMTRGRAANTAYVAIDRPDESHANPTGERPSSAVPAAIAVLAGVLGRTVAEGSAHETLRREQDAAASIRRLAAEYDTIAAAAQHGRWVAIIRASRLPPTQADAVIGSAAFGPLAHTLRRAEAHHLEPGPLLERAIAARDLHGAADVAAVLDARLERLVTHLGDRQPARPRLIAGLIPEAAGPMAEDMATALRERHELMEARARALAGHALQLEQPWTAELGPLPVTVEARALWERQVQIVAAYRDRYAVTGSTLGSPPDSMSQQKDAALAAAAIAVARNAARPTAAPSVPAPIRQGLTRNGPSR